MPALEQREWDQWRLTDTVFKNAVLKHIEMTNARDIVIEHRISKLESTDTRRQTVIGTVIGAIAGALAGSFRW